MNENLSIILLPIIYSGAIATTPTLMMSVKITLALEQQLFLDQ